MPSFELKFTDSRIPQEEERLLADTPHFNVFQSVIREIVSDITCPLLNEKPVVSTLIKDGHHCVEIHTCCDPFNKELDAYFADHNLK